MPITLKIQSSIALFFNIRNASHVKNVFEQHKDKHTHLVSKSALSGALRDLGIHLSAEEGSVLFETFDLDENGGLNLQEFMNVIKYPGKVEQWADSLPLSKLLAHCLSFKGGDDPLREVSRLSSDELCSSTNAYGESVQTILKDALGELKMAYSAMDRMAAGSAGEERSKFQTFKMSSGSVEDFHIGLHGRVGESRAPRLHLKCPFCHIKMPTLQAPHTPACPRAWRKSTASRQAVTMSSSRATTACGRLLARSTRLQQGRAHALLRTCWTGMGRKSGMCDPSKSSRGSSYHRKQD
jgi:hypothetical protein